MNEVAPRISAKHLEEALRVASGPAGSGAEFQGWASVIGEGDVDGPSVIGSMVSISKTTGQPRMQEKTHRPVLDCWNLYECTAGTEGVVGGGFEGCDVCVLGDEDFASPTTER
ncbi:hypothetical protein [Frondihabitans peucedani]|uniref:hypothetical protein n=1 Tax=Frondihabitans peucedani TaxID=598626 RepID=UPI0031D72B3D